MKKRNNVQSRNCLGSLPTVVTGAETVVERDWQLEMVDQDRDGILADLVTKLHILPLAGVVSGIARLECEAPAIGRHGSAMRESEFDRVVKT